MLPATVAGGQGACERIVTARSPSRIGVVMAGMLVAALAAVIDQHKPGDTITHSVVRDGQTKQVPATLTKRPSSA